MADTEKEAFCGYLFVYGTLKKSTSGRAHPLLSEKAKFDGEAEVRGSLYQREGYPGLFIQDTQEEVSGELYRLKDSRLLETLDQYEGCGEKNEPDAEFTRQLLLVTAGGGNRVPAWVYILNHKPEKQSLIRGGVWSS